VRWHRVSCAGRRGGTAASRKQFGLCYRSRLGNDVDGVDHGYKLHLVYGAQASPSEKAYATINDSPEAIAFSWEITTSPVAVTGLKPTSLIVIDSTEVDPADLAALEASSMETPTTTLDCLFRTRSSPLSVVQRRLSIWARRQISRLTTRRPTSSPSRPSLVFSGRSMESTGPLARSLHWLLVRRQRSTQHRPPVILWKATPIGCSTTKKIERRPENAINYCSRNRTFRRSYF
jgi:hypothetical protein